MPSNVFKIAACHLGMFIVVVLIDRIIQNYSDVKHSDAVFVIEIFVVVSGGYLLALYWESKAESKRNDALEKLLKLKRSKQNKA